MKKLRIVGLGIALLLASTTAEAQYLDDDDGGQDVLTIGGGMGFLTFFGDLSKESELSKYTNIRAAYYFNFERRFGNIFGVQLDGLFGKVAFNEVSANVAQNRNFESPIMQFGLNAVFHFDNDVMIKRKSPFSPFIAVGIGYTMFDPHGDLQDKNSLKYFYWQDGTIRDIDEADISAGSAVIIRRDYTYETQLTDSVANYSRSSIAIPLTFGLKWKFTPRVQGRLFATYNLTQTDFIDNVSGNGNNDSYLFTGMSLHYVIRKKSAEEKALYEDVDFSALKQNDSDGDGILDTDDACQGTPEGVEIDEKGCPKDDDNDGVPNYLDKEVGTAAGATVDEFGSTLTDEMIINRHIAYSDSIIEERVQVFSEAPSMDLLKRIEDQMQTRNGAGDGNTAKTIIPAHLMEADANTNGFISADEISGAIDGFFDGSNNFTVKSLHQLIDYFFEQ